MLTAIGKWALGSAQRAQVWTNVYGVARSLLALSTAGSLFFNRATTLFIPATGPLHLPPCQGAGKLSLFCLVNSNHLDFIRILAGLALLVVATGWRPRYTGLIHSWISLSVALSSVTLDGGDQLTSDLVLLLLPVALTDNRKWHWEHGSISETDSKGVFRTLVAASALIAIRFQMAGVYFHAAVAKFRIEEWRDGTAMYYWLTNPTIGAHGWVAHAVSLATRNDVLIPLMTWGAIAIEVVLFMSLVMPKWAWRFVFGIGVAFHALIAVLFGLTSFSIAMLGGLVLYLRPTGDEFVFVGRWLKKGKQLVANSAIPHFVIRARN
ncbi:MAG: sporulation-delaying protein SdpB family protein [Candidatus Acidiferrales bacterium]